MHQQVPCTLKKMILLGSRLVACCKLAPTLARQMWRLDYIIDRNEYLIFRLSESINPWVYSLQFLFKSTNNSWRYVRKCEWVFFFLNTVYYYLIACRLSTDPEIYDLGWLWMAWMFIIRNSIACGQRLRPKMLSDIRIHFAFAELVVVTSGLGISELK